MKDGHEKILGNIATFRAKTIQLSKQSVCTMISFLIYTIEKAEDICDLLQMQSH